MKKSFRTTTALAASLSLMLPNLVPLAQAQQAGQEMFCLNGETPPCADAPEAGVALYELPVETLREMAEEGRLDDEMLAEYGLNLEMLREAGDEQIEAALDMARDSLAAGTAIATELGQAAGIEMEAEVEQSGELEAEAEMETEGAAGDAAASASVSPEAQPEAPVEEVQPEATAEAAPETAAEPMAEAAPADATAETAQPEAMAETAPAEAMTETVEPEVSAETAEAEAVTETAPADAQADATATDAPADTAQPETTAETETASEPMQAETTATDSAQTDADRAARAAELQAQLEAESQAQAEQDAAATTEVTGDSEAGAEAETTATAETPSPTEAEAPTATQADTETAAPDENIDPTAEEPQSAVAASAAASEAEPAEVTETEIDEENSRQSDEEFAASVSTEASNETQTETKKKDRDGLSDFQKALLLGVGAVAVGSLLNNGRQVVANTGDRVVVQGENGLEIYRDDDALLRQPGADLRTETFSDGSTRTTLTREDGTKVVTIRDAQGRVLRRTRVFADGTEIELFDDLAQSDPVDVRSLREMEAAPITISAAEADRAALLEALRAEASVDTGRGYSLRQIREIEPVRALVPAIDLDTLTFATGSAALRPEQASTLVDLGLAIEERLAENPREVFLIEGHTDAVGNDAYNLALSDRRAETVALALTENFAIPPENLVVQGYGERFLKVESQGDVQANRRATVRRITPLLQQVASAQ
ncbi:OmpA family protein [Limimaricola variabilis]|uniref:OmpA family protein n=1 Tax=Limimaricola variabilis TaxID=1492771 RepID=UPI002AC9B8F7|nr:OmpA family protein [Limimaricola variabilis]WPY94648.1 OmpA family protein [Limimaricola variabilis]